MEETFEDIVRRNQRRIYRLVYSFVRNEHDADEITQNAFVNAYRGFGHFRHDSSVETWLSKIAINCMRSYLRKKKMLSIFYVFDGEEKTADFSDSKQNTEREAESNTTMKAVNDAVNRLPARQKEVFVMKHINGMSISDITGTLGIAEGSVKASIFKAVQNLRKSLEGLR